ncbi:FkbM family methyltransferase [Mycobacterium sp. NAZ190054]|uniref:FkbM family methyltransferase n=1 Tax=Mycobacterium sp. NAZ190054 TaxID=1747766 RepID=UPI000795A3A1|nr:FkbM family methyltransferase [Mycobacterium sp. NAZ190054]KWX56720.1 hypothetical protein ASJ79_02090 [Mycobacterium sp. NAZ190054]
MSLKDNVLRTGAVDWLAGYITPRSIGEYLGPSAMDTLIALLWRRERRRGDVIPMLCSRFLRAGGTAIDVGASWGMFTYHFARLVGTAGTVYSYEPHPANVKVLQKLADVNPAVRFRLAAVSDVAGEADLLVPKSHHRLVTAQSSLTHGFDGLARVEVQKMAVPTVVLDDEIPDDGAVDFMKVDVEGHELNVLNGARSMIDRHRPPLLVEIEQRHISFPIGEVFDTIQGLGYQLFYLDRRCLRPIGDFDLQQDQLSLLKEDEFNPFGMPAEYVHNFFAVPDVTLLQGLPVA